MFYCKWSFCPDNPWHSQGNPNCQASYSTFHKGSSVLKSPPRDVPLTWFQIPPTTEVLQHSKPLFLVLINKNFFSVFLHLLFFSFWPLIFIHNVRMFCPLVESEKSCQAGSYENRYLQQVYYYSKQHYSTKMLEHETFSQLTWISSQMSSSKRVAAVWCCRGAIRQWPSVRDW